MEREEFEQLVSQAFDQLPEQFHRAIENLHVVVEDYPDGETVAQMNLRSKHDLLGLYQGIPLNRRGQWYGMVPVVPDKISLYQKNIERGDWSGQRIQEKIREVLIHEIGHYFGMTEDEIRAAGY